MAAETARRDKYTLVSKLGTAPLMASVFCALVLTVTGCAMGGFSLEKAAPDRSTITGSIEKKPENVEERETLSDQTTIQSIVSALNFTQWGKQPVPWANPDTGSQGTITTIAETRSDEGLCRQFETSREAFDGVSIYRGETCMQKGGNWTLTSFAPL